MIKNKFGSELGMSLTCLNSKLGKSWVFTATPTLKQYVLLLRLNKLQTLVLTLSLSEGYASWPPIFLQKTWKWCQIVWSRHDANCSFLGIFHWIWFNMRLFCVFSMPNKVHQHINSIGIATCLSICVFLNATLICTQDYVCSPNGNVTDFNWHIGLVYERCPPFFMYT